MGNPVYADRVQEIFTTTGTGAISLGGPVVGYQAFSSALSNGQIAYYGATDGTNWEIGLGTYASAGDTLTRTTILASSNGGAAVNWAAGNKSIWLDQPAALLAPGQILGTGTNDSASAGNVGEYLQSVVNSASALSITSSTTGTEITSLALTPGDWDVFGKFGFAPTSSTPAGLLWGDINPTANAAFSADTSVNIGSSTLTLSNGSGTTFALDPRRITLASSATYYLNAGAIFGSGALKVFGAIRARRVR